MKKFRECVKNNLNDDVKLKVLAIILLTVVTSLFLWHIVEVKGETREKSKVYFIPKTVESGNDFWTSLIDGAKLAAKEENIDLYISGANSEQDMEGQIKCIKTALDKKPDAIVISPCSYSQMTDVLKEVVENDIKLILIDSVIDEDIADGIVATDNFLAGKILGENASLLIKEDAKIGIMAHVKGSSTAMQREEGIKEGLKDKKDNVVQTDFCGSSYEKAYELTVDLIENNPDVNVIFGTNEYASVGAARAVLDMKREDIKIFGFDNSIEEIKFLEQGVFDAIVIQKPFNMGYLGVKQAVYALDGETIEKNIDSGCKLIDINNMYDVENQRLLFPFAGQK